MYLLAGRRRLRSARPRVRPRLVAATLAAVAMASAPATASAAPAAACDPESSQFAGCPMQAVTVPAQPADPGAAHLTYSGAVVTLKGIARYGGNEYRWDFGDGSAPTAWLSIATPFNLGVTHVYVGSVGQVFTATLSVRNSSDPSVQASATYPVRIALAGPGTASTWTSLQTDVQAQMAVDDALWYLHLQELRSSYAVGTDGNGQPYGSWDSSSLPATCNAVDAMEMLGHVPTGDYAGDPYVEDVRRGLNFALESGRAVAVPSSQSYTNTAQVAVVDQNQNGFGIYFGTDNVGITGSCAQALADSAAPGRVAATGPPSRVAGRSYASVLQDVLDYLAYAQAFTGTAEGSWGYGSSARSGNGFMPMDATWWVPRLIDTIGARMPTAGITVSPVVLQALSRALPLIVSSNADQSIGGFQHYWGATAMAETRATGEAIEAERATGTGPDSVVMQRALGFLYRHWGDGDSPSCWFANEGWAEAMYRTADALLRAQPTLTRIAEFDYSNGRQTGNSFDWYYTPPGQAQQGYATYLLTHRSADGSWTDLTGCGYADDQSGGGTTVQETARDLLVLSRNGTLSVPDISALSWADPTPPEGGSVAAIAGTPLTVPLALSGGLPPYSFTLRQPLTAGLTSSGANATLSLTPAVGDTPVTVDITDASGQQATRSFTIQAAHPRPTLTWPAPTAITYGTALSSAQLDAVVTAPGSPTPMAGTYAYTADADTADATGAVLPAGAHTLHVTFTPADTSVDPVTGSVALTVGLAPLSLTADPQTRSYGAPNPALTATVSGFVNGDTAAVLTGTPSCASTATVSSGVGTYPISCTGGTLSAANYTLATFSDGTLTVTPAQLLVTADPKSRLFGAANPPLTASISGFLNGDTAATATTGGPSCTSTASVASAVGGYPITCTIGTLSSPNYSFTFAGGTLTVSATRTITGVNIGPLTIGAGQAVLIAPGATLIGPVTITPGGALDIEGGTVIGLVRTDRTGSNAIRVCGARVLGPVTLSGGTGPIVFGDGACAPSTFAGAVALTGNTGGVSMVGATVYGALTITGTRGGFTYSGNKVVGTVRLQDNA